MRAEHHCQELMREGKFVAIETIICHQQPSG
jgi:hypothetical protein